jgi:hypothetical protein
MKKFTGQNHHTSKERKTCVGKTPYFNSNAIKRTRESRENNETEDNLNEKTYDGLLIGQWKNPHTLEILEFKTDGTYTLSEAEEATWYTASGGRLWMFGTPYTYALSENNTVLSITEQGFTRVYQRV